jgi:uncharacterized membrane protein YoaK (UPF0700 family)
MSSSVSLDVVANPPVRWEETLQIALLLAFAGGYLDAYTWIVHGVVANAQTANPVLLWVDGTADNGREALHFAPPMLPFAVGIVIAFLLRRMAENRACAISTVMEISAADRLTSLRDAARDRLGA